MMNVITGFIVQGQASIARKLGIEPDFRSAARATQTTEDILAKIERLQKNIDSEKVLASLKGAIRKAARKLDESDMWKGAAAASERDRGYYRGLLVKIGELFGQEAQIADDGSDQGEVLAAKVPELVERLYNSAALQTATIGSLEGQIRWNKAQTWGNKAAEYYQSKFEEKCKECEDLKSNIDQMLVAVASMEPPRAQEGAKAMNDREVWMIADIRRLEEAPRGGSKLPDNRAPKFVHTDRETAEKELLRLQQRYPDGEFVLLEAVAWARPVVKTNYCVEPISRVPF